MHDIPNPVPKALELRTNKPLVSDWHEEEARQLFIEKTKPICSQLQ